MPQVDLPTALAGCFATCTAYALLLCTEKGKWMTLNVTWITVIVGVSLVLGWIATQAAHTAEVDLYFFVAGGFPIVIRSLWLLGVNLWAYALYVLKDSK
jgi:hypothetical protein